MEAKDAGDNRETAVDYLHLFLQSRQAMEVSPGTLSFYRVKLGRFLSELDVDTAKRQDIEAFLLQFKNPGNRHAYYRAVKTFYNWRAETFGLPSPMKHIKAPKLSKLILPSLTRDEVLKLLEATKCVRDKAIISLFTESGLRLSELASIQPDNINWTNRTIRVIGKGRKEAVAPFGPLTESYLRAWLGEYKADVIYIVQYLAGLRDIGEGLGKVHPVNAASVKHDGKYDVISFSDAWYLLRYLAGRRRLGMEWRRGTFPWRHSQR